MNPSNPFQNRPDGSCTCKGTGIIPDGTDRSGGDPALKNCECVKRVEESYELIRRHLVTLHEDGDGDSLWVRFGELVNHFVDNTNSLHILTKTLYKYIEKTKKD